MICLLVPVCFISTQSFDCLPLVAIRIEHFNIWLYWKEVHPSGYAWSLSCVQRSQGTHPRLLWEIGLLDLSRWWSSMYCPCLCLCLSSFGITNTCHTSILTGCWRILPWLMLLWWAFYWPSHLSSVVCPIYLFTYFLLSYFWGRVTLCNCLVWSFM